MPQARRGHLPPERNSRMVALGKPWIRSRRHRERDQRRKDNMPRLLRRRTALGAWATAGGALAACATPGADAGTAKEAAKAGQAKAPTEASSPSSTGQAAQAKPLGKGIEQVLSLDFVHLIDIQADAAKLHLLDTDRSVKVNCDVSIDGEKFKDASITEKGDIGSSSSLAEKPGFNVRFGKDRPEGLKKLTLNNARQDVTFLHEHVAYELYRRAGLPAPRTAHGLVTLNGTPYGLFVLVEPKDTLYLARHFGKENDKGNLYEVDMVDFADGYLDPVHVSLKDADDDPTTFNPATRADLRALAEAVRAPEDQVVAAVTEQLDLNAFLTAYALDALIGHVDGPMFNTNNYYLYKNPGTKRFVLLAHGIDQGFDVSFDPRQPPKLALAQRIRALPELEVRWRAELNRVMDKAWLVPDLSARIDQAVAIAKTSRATAAGASGAAQRDLDMLLSFGLGMRDVVDARRAQWVAQPF